MSSKKLQTTGAQGPTLSASTPPVRHLLKATATSRIQYITRAKKKSQCVQMLRAGHAEPAPGPRVAPSNAKKTLPASPPGTVGHSERQAVLPGAKGHVRKKAPSAHVWFWLMLHEDEEKLAVWSMLENLSEGQDFVTSTICDTDGRVVLRGQLRRLSVRA